MEEQLLALTLIPSSNILQNRVKVHFERTADYSFMQHITCNKSRLRFKFYPERIKSQNSNTSNKHVLLLTTIPTTWSLSPQEWALNHLIRYLHGSSLLPRASPNLRCCFRRQIRLKPLQPLVCQQYDQSLQLQLENMSHFAQVSTCGNHWHWKPLPWSQMG